VRLQLALHTVVRQRRVALLNAEKLLELGVGKNLSLIIRVLQIVLLNVGANVFCHVDSRLEFSRTATDELCHLLVDRDLLQETRVDVGALLRLLAHHANGLRLESLQSLVQALEELATGALALTKRLDLTLNVCNSLVEPGGDRLAGCLQTRKLRGNFLCRRGSVYNKRGGFGLLRRSSL